MHISMHVYKYIHMLCNRGVEFIESLSVDTGRENSQPEPGEHLFSMFHQFFAKSNVSNKLTSSFHKISDVLDSATYI